MTDIQLDNYEIVEDTHEDELTIRHKESGTEYVIDGNAAFDLPKLKADSVTVETPPEEPTDAVRKEEADAIQTDVDGKLDAAGDEVTGALTWGDYELDYDEEAEQFVFRNQYDGTSAMTLTHDSVVQIVNGLQAGTIQPADDSVVQIVNQQVTAESYEDEEVGYSFALNGEEVAEVRGEADGLGGVKSAQFLSNNTPEIHEFDFTDEIAEIPIPDSNYVFIEFDMLGGQVTGSDALMKCSNDGGDTYFTGQYKWVVEQKGTDGSNFSNNNDDDSEILLVSSLSSNSSPRYNPLSISISGAQVARHTTFYYSGAIGKGSHAEMVHGAADLNEDDIVDTIKIYEGAEEPLFKVKGRVLSY